MSEPGSERDDAEILGRLPRTRPGRRSPRRDDAAQKRARAAARDSAATEAASRPAGGSGAEAQAGAEAHDAGPADALADVARTGVAVAGGAVGLGLRAAGGALRAIRGTVERR